MIDKIEEQVNRIKKINDHPFDEVIKIHLKGTPPERSCDGCTKCCGGWLRGEVHGHQMSKGVPCFYLEKKCTIYDNRPNFPCRQYKCSWLAEDTFPHWMKPDLANIIITKRQVDGILYYEITEAGAVLDAKVLSWLTQWALNTGNNIVYYIDSAKNKIGSLEFAKADI